MIMSDPWVYYHRNRGYRGCADLSLQDARNKQTNKQTNNHNISCHFSIQSSKRLAQHSNCTPLDDDKSNVSSEKIVAIASITLQFKSIPFQPLNDTKSLPYSPHQHHRMVPRLHHLLEGSFFSSLPFAFSALYVCINTCTEKFKVRMSNTPINQMLRLFLARSDDWLSTTDGGDSEVSSVSVRTSEPYEIIFHTTHH